MRQFYLSDPQVFDLEMSDFDFRSCNLKFAEHDTGQKRVTRPYMDGIRVWECV